MPRGGYRGGKPPTKSLTGERAQMVAFRLSPETIVQLEAIAAGLGCSKTGVVERLIAQSTAASLAAPDADVQALRLQLETSVKGRLRLVSELAGAKEREWAYQETIAALEAQLSSPGLTWAHGVLHLGSDAGPEDVVHAYRELSKRFHPDANRGDPVSVELFRDLVRARDQLLSGF